MVYQINNIKREEYRMQEKKQVNFKSPDMSQLREVVIDLKTKIYIPLDADPEEARARYWSRKDAQNASLSMKKQPNLD